MNKFQKQIEKFAKDRNWGQYHNPKDLLLGIVEEIGEFRNIIKWEQDSEKLSKIMEEKKVDVKDGIGDIYWFLALLANQTGVDIDKAISEVIKLNKKRFPLIKTKNRHTNIHLGGHDGKNNN
jgi:NTP pyrophosphatase (non-canonical NTP hydrolase)